MKESPRARRRAVLMTGLAALGAPVFGAGGQAGSWPTRPVQLVVAAPAGGPSDRLARILAKEMLRVAGQPVWVANRPGAAGSLAAEFVLRAARDGHTLLMTSVGNATGQTLMPGLAYDINRDFAHITQLVSGANVLVTHPATGVRTLEHLVARARREPDRLTYASAGNGSSGHLAMEMLKQCAGISLTHVPYRGGASAMRDLLHGRVDLMFMNQDAVILDLRSGRLRALAITSRVRNRLFPQVPTAAESGCEGFEVTAWAGLSAPGRTPGAVIQRIHAAVAEAMQGSFTEAQAAVGAQVVGSKPAEFAAFLREETERWRKVIRMAKVKPG